MKHPILNLALLSVLAGPVVAQSDSDYDAFGIVDDSLPLEELVPMDDTLPPPQPYVDDEAGTKGDVSDDVSGTEAPVAPITQEAAEPVVPAVPQIASVTAPEDWQAHDIHGFTFSAPPDWAVVKDRKDALILFGGDKETRSGPSFAVMFDSNGLPDSDEAEILSQSEITLADGTPFHRYELRATLGDDVELRSVTLLSPEQNRDGDYTIIMLGVYNDDYETHRETLESVLATFKTGPIERSEALSGLVSYDLPNSWRIHESVDSMYFSVSPQYYPGYVAIATAHWVNKEQGFDSDVPDTASAPQDAAIFGHEAELRAWPGTSDEFFAGSRAVPGRFEYYRLKSCLPGGEPIGILIAGSSEFHDGEDLKLILSSVTLSLPDDMQDCATPAATPAPAVPVARTPEQADQAPQVSGNAQPPAMAAQGTAIDIQGARFTLPLGWTAIYDSASDKSFTSPDGRFTILSFWWFPDEPLTSDGDVSVKQVVNDHEPSTRITSQTGPSLSIMNVTERARADEKRFIFTLESSDVSQDDLRAQHDRLIATLRFDGAFDPAGNREMAQATESPAQDTITSPMAEKPAWHVYENPRFGTQISYPDDLFSPMAAPSNNDGRSFEGVNGPQKFLVFGQYNIDGLGVRDLMAQDASSGGYDSVTYEKAGDDWYLLSGFRDGYIFHRKVLVDQINEVFHVFEITYPAALQARLDPVTAEMAASFSMGDLPAFPAENTAPQPQDMQESGEGFTEDSRSTNDSTYRVPSLHDLILQHQQLK